MKEQEDETTATTRPPMLCLGMRPSFKFPSPSIFATSQQFLTRWVQVLCRRIIMARGVYDLLCSSDGRILGVVSVSSYDSNGVEASEQTLSILPAS